eukprot:gene14949-21006_t
MGVGYALTSLAVHKQSYKCDYIHYGVEAVYTQLAIDPVAGNGICHEISVKWGQTAQSYPGCAHLSSPSRPAFLNDGPFLISTIKADNVDSSQACAQRSTPSFPAFLDEDPLLNIVAEADNVDSSQACAQRSTPLFPAFLDEDPLLNLVAEADNVDSSQACAQRSTPSFPAFLDEDPLLNIVAEADNVDSSQACAQRYTPSRPALLYEGPLLEDAAEADNADSSQARAACSPLPPRYPPKLDPSLYASFGLAQMHDTSYSEASSYHYIGNSRSSVDAFYDLSSYGLGKLNLSE